MAALTIASSQGANELERETLARTAASFLAAIHVQVTQDHHFKSTLNSGVSRERKEVDTVTRQVLPDFRSCFLTVSSASSRSLLRSAHAHAADCRADRAADGLLRDVTFALSKGPNASRTSLASECYDELAALAKGCALLPVSHQAVLVRLAAAE
jgi:hypothetical protein